MNTGKTSEERSLQWRKWLSVLFAAWPLSVSEERVEAYSVALGDLSAERMELAVKESLREHDSPYPPTPGQVRGYLRDALERERQRPERCAHCGSGIHRTDECLASEAAPEEVRKILATLAGKMSLPAGAPEGQARAPEKRGVQSAKGKMKNRKARKAG